jgi:hypothetical protein
MWICKEIVNKGTNINADGETEKISFALKVISMDSASWASVHSYMCRIGVACLCY